MHPAFNCDLGSVNKLFDEHHVLERERIFLKINITLKKRRVERRPSRVFATGNLQRICKIVGRFEFKSENPEVQPGRFEKTRVDGYRGVRVVEINCLTLDWAWFCSASVVFVHT